MAGWGCSKAEPPPRIPKYYGVEVNLPKLKQTLEVPGLDVTTQVRQVTMRLRYGQLIEAMKMLDAVRDMPAVTDPQKQVIDEVLQQMKQAAENQAAQRAAPAPH